MFWLWRILRGGLLKERRAETLGLAAGLTGAIKALCEWATGDLSVFGLARALAENWPLIAGGVGLATLAAKIKRNERPPAQVAESVSSIADRALRR